MAAAELAAASLGVHDAAGLPDDDEDEARVDDDDEGGGGPRPVAWNTVRLGPAEWRREAELALEALELKDAGNAAIGRQDYAAAEQAYAAAINRVDSCSVLWSNLALVFLQRPDASAEHALLAADRALGLDRSNVKAAARRGVALSTAGRHEEAVLWMMELVERHPEDGQLADKLLAVQLAAGVFDEGGPGDNFGGGGGGGGAKKRKKGKKKKR